MEKMIKRIVLKLFPELSAAYHLPIFAEVVGVRETPDAGNACDEFRPRYAVDVQVLDEYGEPDLTKPVLRDVILSVPVAGHEMGQFAYPENGTWVELAFAYGSPNRPFIRSVLPHRLTLPDVARGEQRWQHSADVFQRADKDGNWQRMTDIGIHDTSLTRLIDALDVVENFHQAVKNTEAHDTEIIGAIKRIEAFGAVVVQAGGVMDLASIDHLRITTKANAIVRALGSVLSTADVKFHSEAPKSWVGDDTENALRLLSELAGIVADLADLVEAHSHVSAGAILPATVVADKGGEATAVKGRVDGIAE